jgi:hypothetical protein
MTRRQSIARFLAGRAARIILAGSDPVDAPDNTASQVSDILVSNLVVREDAANGLVGYLYAIGTTGAVTFSITVDADGIFAIQNGNELHKVDAFGTGADYAITIKATETVSGAEYSEAFTIDVIPTEDDEDDTGIGDGGGSGDVEIPDDEDPDSDTDPYVEPPVEVVTEVAAKVSGKTGGTSIFLKDWGIPVAGRAYVMKYSADWTGMSAQGRYAAVGFGFKQGNSFHMVGLRGNGAVSTTMLGSRLYGDWRKSKQFTITNDGAATHGTKNGPNWLRLTIGGDGTTYTLESSADGATWAAEITDAAPSPFTDATDATQFGPAAYFYEEDKGPFVISISEFWQKPINTVLPAITGTPTEDETLTVSDGTWSGAGLTFTRQWKRDGVNISAATGTTYVLTSDDVDTDITAAVTATNPGGATTATSAAVGPIEAGFVDLLVDSANLASASWTPSNAPTRTANTVEDTGAGYQTIQQAFTTVAGQSYIIQARILKHAGTHASAFRIEADDDCVFNANTGAVSRTAPNIVTLPTMTDDGTHWIYESYFIAEDTSTLLVIWPAIGTGHPASYSSGTAGALEFDYLRVIADPVVYDENFGNSAVWSRSGICIGKPNRLEDVDGNFALISRSFATTNGVQYTVTARILKNTGAKGMFRIGASDDFGFNVDTGQVSGTGMSATDDGTHWIFTLVRTAGGSSTLLTIYPAVSSAWPLSYSSAATGYIEIDEFSFA